MSLKKLLNYEPTLWQLIILVVISTVSIQHFMPRDLTSQDENDAALYGDVELLFSDIASQFAGDKNYETLNSRSHLIADGRIGDPAVYSRPKDDFMRFRITYRNLSAKTCGQLALHALNGVNNSSAITRPFAVEVGGKSVDSWSSIERACRYKRNVEIISQSK